MSRGFDENEGLDRETESVMTEQELRIIYEDDSILVVDKPSGVHVHPPENSQYGISYAENLMARLRDHVEHYVYPAHRLDPATSGLVVFARTGPIAGLLQEQFREHRVRKTYWAVVRGWVEPELGRIERPLRRDGVGTIAPALTQYRTLGRIELPVALGKHPTSRYTGLECRPETGVYHQIRRHLSGISHPIIGDAQHGDGVHSRYFRDELGLPGLWLRAVALEFRHPIRPTEEIKLRAPSDPRWEKLQRKLDFGFDSERMAAV